MSVLSNGYLLTLGAAAGFDFDLEFLVIGGGGASSTGPGAANNGGGAGGYISSISGESSGGGASALSAVGLTTTGTYTVTVGAAGSNSVFSGTDTSASPFDHTAIRGGGIGGSGGSGGGGNYTLSDKSGGAGTANQGYAGGSGNSPFSECNNSPFFCVEACRHDAYHGGGGGAGSAGSGINGGNGVASSVTGTSVTYAGGGGGKSVCSNNFITGSAGSGQSNYGGGGHNGGAAQNGVVFLKYPTTVSISNPGGGLTMSTSVVSGNNVTTITAGTGDIEFSEV